jgi:hypothetical protein
VKEGRAGKADLVSLFKEVCLMEERFRDEIKRYLRRPDAPHITPKQIPPLIAATGSLPPTARNKMFNAMLASKNFGGKWSMPTLTAAKKPDLGKNQDSLHRLLVGAKKLGRFALGGVSGAGKKMTSDAMVFEATNAQLCAFLSAYRWLETDYRYPERPVDIGLQIEFLEKQKHGITSWLIVAPQRRDSYGEPLALTGDISLAVKERHRLDGRGFQVFGESLHRSIAEVLANIQRPDKLQAFTPNDATSRMRDSHRGIMLLYPVREEQSDDVSIGFELLFPENKLPYEVHFTVRRKSEQDKVIVGPDD